LLPHYTIILLSFVYRNNLVDMIDVLISPPEKKAAIKAQKASASNGDRPLVSLLKTISWRIVGTIDTITISYIVTGQIRSALSIGSIEVVSKMILYYIHERIWTKRSKAKSTGYSRLKKDEIISGIGTN
jgi:uncharacterized membrane protein